jgi:hypothetical protein
MSSGNQQSPNARTDALRPIPDDFSNPPPETPEDLLDTLDIYETQIHHLSHTLEHHAKLSRRPARLAAAADRLTTENNSLMGEAIALRVQCEKLTKENKELALENEQLKAQNERLRIGAAGFMFEENRIQKKKLEIAEKEMKVLQERVGTLEVEKHNYEEEIKLLTEDDEVYREEAAEAQLDAV